jgi:hypothetical protein
MALDISNDAKKKGKEVVVSENKGYIKSDGGDYKCIKKCYWNLRVFEEGEIVSTKKGDMIPHHFKKVDKK